MTRFGADIARRARHVPRIGALLLIGAVLAGCNVLTPQAQLALSPPYSPEWCQALRAFPNSGTHLYSLGQCHERGVAGFDRNDDVIAYYYTQAARWGDTNAGAALARLQRPVPVADLQAEARARADRERQTRQVVSAITSLSRPAQTQPQRPLSMLEQQQLEHERIMGRAPPARPAQTVVPTVAPIWTPSFGVSSSATETNIRRSESTSVRENCVNGVCRTETVTCVDGVCTTTTQ